jgi:hypothetical protein
LPISTIALEFIEYWNCEKHLLVIHSFLTRHSATPSSVNWRAIECNARVYIGFEVILIDWLDKSISSLLHYTTAREWDTRNGFYVSCHIFFSPTSHSISFTRLLSGSFQLKHFSFPSLLEFFILLLLKCHMLFINSSSFISFYPLATGWSASIKFLRSIEAFYEFWNIISNLLVENTIMELWDCGGIGTKARVCVFAK